ncbi:ssDNA-binding protein [Aurantimonas sp. A2-1-M11]|uniref:ssDNA-binding protein n=1 Tax=Aurantimonas sp. A2-1-M11 TaxID=3113712 RepID=UPI002F94E823
MDAFKTAKFLDSTGTYMSPACRMMYASLFKKAPTAKGQTDVTKFKFQITILIPADADISVLEEAAEATKQNKWTPAALKTKKVKLPILDTRDEPRLAEYAEDFPHMIRLKSNTRPGVKTKAMADVNEADEPDEIYNGRWCRVTMQPFAYEVESAGVSFGLGNVQLLDHADKIAGGAVAAESEFEAVGEDELEDMVG